MGERHFDKEDYHSAEKYILKALDMDDSRIQAKINLFRLYERTGRKDDADFILESIKYNTSRYETYIGRRLMESEENAESIPHFEQSIRSDPSYFTPYYFLSQALWNLGEQDRACEVLKEAPRRFSEKVEEQRSLRAHCEGKDFFSFIICPKCRW